MEGVLEVAPSQLESVHNQGLDLPYVQFDRVQPAVKLVYEGEEYWYYRTLPLRGYGAVLARYARQLMGEGKKVLVARFLSGRNFPTSQHWDRLYLYAPGVKPIGAGKATV
ncbi:MAG TPA: hypothetical protein VJ256_05750 [Dehalococcoidia bacterium]|nr:hypothetical protein [Dehalococcoidia bacterium]